MKYKGVGPKKLLKLLNFLFAYEECIKSFSTNNEFYGKYCANQYLSQICKFVTVCEAGHVTTVRKSKNEINITNSKKTKLLSFMNHLRNAFAHSTFIVKGKFFYFEDNNKGNCTASGCINLDLLFNFLKIYNF